MPRLTVLQRAQRLLGHRSPSPLLAIPELLDRGYTRREIEAGLQTFLALVALGSIRPTRRSLRRIVEDCRG